MGLTPRDMRGSELLLRKIDYRACFAAGISLL
jgi:hypothetical protein